MKNPIGNTSVYTNSISMENTNLSKTHQSLLLGSGLGNVLGYHMSVTLNCIVRIKEETILMNRISEVQG